MQILLLVILILGVITVKLQKSVGQDYNVTDENELIGKLMKDYKFHELPPGAPIKVYPFFRIKHITALNESQQTMTVSGTFFLRWRDTRLEWTPSQHKGIKDLDVNNLKHGKIWRPDARFFNPGEGATWDANFRSRNEKLRYNGVVWDWAGASFTLTPTCQFDFSDFPYDKQSCSIVFYSYNSYDQVNFDISRFDFRTVPKNFSTPIYEAKQKPLRTGNFMITNGAITSKFLTPTGVKSNSSSFPASMTVQLLEIRLDFERISSYFGVTVVLPLVLTNIFTVISFLIESKSLAFSSLISILFLHAIFHDDFLQTMPPTVGDPPKIVYYYGVSLCLAFVGLVLRTIVALHFSSAEKLKSDSENSAEKVLNLGTFIVFGTIFVLATFSLLL